ncbi:Hpt domain-containing protein [Prosthecomicrobium sp. N25]|uniref:Hpt domain-containing protein n=1 Tax=Prosthecomicrobium sp. N25 TaxID=3129254 RepID=UPI0030774F19
MDLAHLARLTFGSRDLEREVLRLFLGQSRGLLERIRAAEAADQRFMAAHTLKGSARGIGAVRVARLAEAAERKDLPAGDAARILAELARAVEEANGFIRDVLED